LPERILRELGDKPAVHAIPRKGHGDVRFAAAELGIESVSLDEALVLRWRKTEKRLSEGKNRHTKYAVLAGGKAWADGSRLQKFS
jgi:hypothetical protein